jgi:hypothetical protein
MSYFYQVIKNEYDRLKKTAATQFRARGLSNHLWIKLSDFLMLKPFSLLLPGDEEDKDYCHAWTRHRVARNDFGVNQERRQSLPFEHVP